MNTTDTRLRLTGRGADTEERAALLARAGRYEEALACYSVVAGRLWERIKAADWTLRLDGLAPSSRDRNAPPAESVKALRAEWRRIHTAMRAMRQAVGP